VYAGGQVQAQLELQEHHSQQIQTSLPHQTKWPHSILCPQAKLKKTPQKIPRLTMTPRRDAQLAHQCARRAGKGLRGGQAGHWRTNRCPPRGQNLRQTLTPPDPRRIATQIPKMIVQEYPGKLIGEKQQENLLRDACQHLKNHQNSHLDQNFDQIPAQWTQQEHY
jgi:hypothetical protein